MFNISNYIVKITSKNELGSGFLYLPENNPECAYIFTARHCIYGKGVGNGALKNDILLSFYGEGKEPTEYNVQEKDILITGSNNEAEDIALLIIPKEAIPISCSKYSGPQLIELYGPEKECFVNGVPKVTGNVSPRTLKNCFIEPDKDNASQVQASVKDAIVDNYNADDLVEGYSGSGFFIDNGKSTYVFGVVSRYEESSKRLLGINFSLVNQLLKQNSLPLIELLNIETNKKLLDDIDKLNANTDRILNRIRTNIGSLHLDREEVEMNLTEMIEESPFTLISGHAGMGKSALLKKVLETHFFKYSVIAFRGEELDKSSISEILRSIQINASLTDLLNSPYFSHQKVIVIDSIEKLLETNNSETIIDFFSLIKSREDLRLVITGRSYALEQLKIRFLKDLPMPSLIEIPLLNKELLLVEQRYPHIKALLDKPGIRKLLQIPFNLDKAIFLENKAFDEDISSEWAFKQVMWDYVIENREKETDINIRKKRGEAFLQIARDRAIQMISYVKAENIDSAVIEVLEKDNIIESQHKLKNRYSPSHDIFEDWALTRIIEDKFSDWKVTGSAVKEFFANIGDHPAMRRAFRIWLSERMQEVDYAIEKFLINVLTANDLRQFWQDETLIAIMQSSYSQELLSKSKELLFNHSFLLLKRCLLLLKVACQTPDLPLIKILTNNTDEGDVVYQSQYLKPFGEGWSNMINFIADHISQLRVIYPSIILILLDWKNGLDQGDSLPPEATNVAKIVLDYFNCIKSNYADDEYEDTKDDKVSDCVSLLLRVTGSAKQEVSRILEDALTTKSENYRIKHLNKKFLEYSLSYLHSKWLCRHLPELVIKIAEREWFYYPPSPQETAERQSHSLFKSLPKREEPEDIFGVSTNHKYEYRPPSGMQTPIRYLLYFHPIYALNFITRLANHSVDAYFKSNFLTTDGFAFKAEERIEYKLKIDGKEILNKGTYTLWCMYRGPHVASPYLLQSTFMALENWLLSLAKSCQDQKDPYYEAYKKLLDTAVDILLQKSHSVSTTAIILSIATAYPKLFGAKIFPLLKEKEFYKWDLHRAVTEREPTFFRDDPRYIINERIESARFKHRKWSIEDLVRQLFTSGFGKEMSDMLDAFYAENPSDTTWKIALNRMDLRKLEFVESTETGFIVQTKIDDDLKEITAKNEEKHGAISQVSAAGNWLANKYERKPVENDSYNEWKKHYNTNLNYNKSIKGIGIWVHQGFAAAVGIRDFSRNLTEEELRWCIETILSIVSTELNKDPYSISFQEDSPISAFDVDPALETLPSLLPLCAGEAKRKVKETIFAALLYIDNEPYKDKLLETTRNILWQTDSEFAIACIAGMLEYAKLASTRKEMRYTYPSNKKEEREKEKLISKYKKALAELFDSVVTGRASFRAENINASSHSAWILTDILILIPFNTSEQILIEYIDIILKVAYNSIEKESGYGYNDSFPHNLIQKVEKYYSRFLLARTDKDLITKTDALINWVFDSQYKLGNYKDKKFEFVNNTLDYLISWVDEDHSLTPNFWKMWEYIYERSVETNKTYFDEVLLIYSPYWPTKSLEWKPMTGKKAFFQKAITFFGPVTSTIHLLSGIGFSELIPEGIKWYADILRKDNSLLNDKNNKYLTEKLSQRVFYNKQIRNFIKEDTILRESFILILDELINKNSSVAFLIREDFISLKR